MYSSTAVTLLLLAWLTLAPAYVSAQASDQHKLFRDLMRGYNKDLRPVRNVSTLSVVTIDMTVSNLIELDMKKQFMHILGWIDFSWTDEFLRWDPANYSGLQDMYIPTHQIWKPDVVLYNSVDQEQSMMSIFPDTAAHVQYNGSVYWAVPTRLLSTCKVDIANFPFDSQKCELNFMSWSYDSRFIDLTLVRRRALQLDFVPNGQWHLIHVEGEKKYVFYDYMDKTWVHINYYVIVQRKVFFYVFYLLIPTLMFIMIGVLVFFLPPQSDEKVSLAVTLLLAMIVFLLLVFENIPRTDDIPFLGGFFGTVVILLSLTSVMSIIVESCSDGSLVGSRPPHCLRRVTLIWLGRLFGLRKAICKTLGEMHEEDVQRARMLNARRFSKYTVNEDSREAGLSRGKSLSQSDQIRVQSRIHQTGMDNSQTLANGVQRPENCLGRSNRLSDNGSTVAISSNRLNDDGIYTISGRQARDIRRDDRLTTRNAVNHSASQPDSYSPSPDETIHETEHGRLADGVWRILNEVKSIRLDKQIKKEQQERDERVQKEWVLVAMVIDRLCLITFSLANVALLVWVIAYGIIF